MTTYSVEQIKEMSESVREWRGWDLAQVKTRRAPVPWDYAEVARGILTGKDIVLDMGCGDGKVLASLADGFTRGIGVDISKERIADARLSLPMKLRMRVHFTRASAHAVPAPDASFSVVLDRQAPLFPDEIDRVLAPGGVFITQQVGPQNARAIYAAFEEARGPLPQWPGELLLPHTAEKLKSKGFTVIDRQEYDVPYIFENAESLLHWLQSVPPDFDIDRDAATVLEVLDRLGTPHGIVTNEHRELLVMQKGS